MERFAKVVELEDEGVQVLFFVEYDGDRDVTVLHQKTIVDDAQADMAVEYPGEQQAEAAGVVERADEEHARIVLREIRKLLYEGPPVPE